MLLVRAVQVAATFKAKTQLALNETAGVMIWELSTDVAGSSSLLNAIDEVIQANGLSGRSPGGGSCPNWISGTQYYVGDVVLYQGAYYITVNDNSGYDPVISAWF